MAAEFDPEPHILRLQHLDQRLTTMEAQDRDVSYEYQDALRQVQEIEKLLRLYGIHHPIIEKR